MQFGRYDILTLDFSDGLISWPADVVTAYLSTRQPLAADTTLSDAQPLATNYYAPGRMQSKAVSMTGAVATLRSAPVEVAISGPPFSFQYTVFANANNGNRLMFWYALPAPVAVQSSTFTIGQAAADGLYDVCALQ